jgi:hypothetical protein
MQGDARGSGRLVGLPAVAQVSLARLHIARDRADILMHSAHIQTICIAERRVINQSFLKSESSLTPPSRRLCSESAAKVVAVTQTWTWQCPLISSFGTNSPTSTSRRAQPWFMVVFTLREAKEINPTTSSTIDVGAFKFYLHRSLQHRLFFKGRPKQAPQSVCGLSDVSSAQT